MCPKIPHLRTIPVNPKVSPYINKESLDVLKSEFESFEVYLHENFFDKKLYFCHAILELYG
ncbi:15886_t:CDS:2 [Dentiscutata erythropus]|uniref:15886_t:CDS:1 n=1 Tax=Dentiscutata erythropus TaxID=1348616 RepID=A0A9N9EU95_9GLOM|nr:15886_t:CDS:2 [Dentiscutata erythropus]